MRLGPSQSCAKTVVTDHRPQVQPYYDAVSATAYQPGELGGNCVPRWDRTEVFDEGHFLLLYYGPLWNLNVSSGQV